MKPKNSTVLLYLRFTLAGTFALAAMALVVTATKMSVAPTQALAPHYLLKKGDPDAPGMNKAAVFGGGELRGAERTPEVEAYLKRAYPATEIPMSATINAQNGWASLNAGKHSPGTWQLIGPNIASAPGVLNGLGDGAPYITAGRVLAIALAPNCTEANCRMWVAAAGGGVWRTDKAFHTNPSQNWQFVSSSFATNAVGALVLDPNDPTGNTLYAGTGEPNAGVDSEAGMGIYKTTDGGNTWTLLPGSVAPGSNFQGRAISSIAIAPNGDILVGVARALRGISQTDGGGFSNPPPATNPAPFGVYRSTNGGATFTQIWNGAGSLRGVNSVKLDPSVPTIIYAAAFQVGVYRSNDNGATWTQIKAPRDAALNTDRAEFSVNKLPNGKTRLFTGIGNNSIAPGDTAHIYRTDDAQTALDANFTDLTTAQTDNYCGDPAVGGAQCWYDNLVYSPAGYPDIIYIGGNMSYSHLGTIDNGRAVLLSMDGGVTWSDMTQDGDPQRAEFTHPDQHAMVTLPSNPLMYWEGSDGGIISSDGQLADVSYKCDQRPLTPAQNAFCKSMLSRVPHQLANNINRGFSTLQFQSLSVDPKHPKNTLQGGTQDNGTWQNAGNNANNPVWNQIMYGDGGQSGFSSGNSALRFNSFSTQASDVNFRNGEPTSWVIVTGAIVSSPEASYFYAPNLTDPSPANPGTIFQGSFSVWRTQDWGGNQAYLEANCPEFTTSSANPACGDFVRIGPAGATDLTDTFAVNYGPDRRGGAISAIARTASNAGSIWVATGAGRIFYSANSNAAAGSVVWERLDQSSTADPGRFPASIYIDPNNANHALVSYSGYNFNTVQPGHVFEVMRTGAGSATWTDVSFNLPDLPINQVVRDDVTGDLYAASDFGVMKLPNGTTSWVVAGSGLPMVEVPSLTIVPSQRILYAATHGRSAWQLTLP